MSDLNGMVDPRIFEDLQTKIDEDAEVRDQIKAILQTLERQCRNAQSVLSRAHSTPAAHLQPVLESAERAIKEEAESIQKLASVASNYPYYKYNGSWTRDVQNVIFAVLLCGWLGGLNKDEKSVESGRLLTIEEVGEILQVPVNLKDRDAFHISIEEYLLSLISLIEELSRLAINSVTLGDYQRPLQISQFVKDLHAGFQILNLKNDVLRRRSDSIKYNVKKIEDIDEVLKYCLDGFSISEDGNWTVAAVAYVTSYGRKAPKHEAHNPKIKFLQLTTPEPEMPPIDPITMSGISPVSGDTSKPKSLPTDMLPSDIARIFTHIQPAILLSAYYFRFSALVADPVPTLLHSLLPVAILQVAYAALCLPASGSNMARKLKPGEKRKGVEGGEANHKIFTTIFALILTATAVPAITALQILFGAPFTTHIEHTILSSAHISLLALFPLFYIQGMDSVRWLEVASLYAPMDEVFGAALGCALGAWLGAVPIPLDWDREWQRWPVTVVTGAFAGEVSDIVALAWAYGN
ncbi:putative Translin-1 [Sclerotinia borealis F-4128]|uniref:Putative Translin-1 n=1 Tax=Sclerotinia borealis (strain F-4128) TaxID=1432307 RepID=W9C8Y8_SCLBF|nr:putative Translin-1 [Sclerotinia borealis F-4128]